MLPGAILKCEKCGKEVRWGYPTYAVEFASSKRGAPTEEIIEDFFEFNKSILRTEPEKCPHCGAEKKDLKKTRDVD